MYKYARDSVGGEAPEIQPVPNLEPRARYRIVCLSVRLSVSVSLSMVVHALSVSPIHLWLMIICTYNDGVYLCVFTLYLALKYNALLF